MLSFCLGSLLWMSSLTAQAPTVKIIGDVLHPLSLTASEVSALPHAKVTASAHDQAGT